MKCELCAYSVESCRVASLLGVDRVELCASPSDGGITPSLGTIEEVCSISGIDVSVMIRPRGGDFLYTDEEFRLMLSDIRHARSAGAKGVVFGVLKADGTVDVERTRLLVDAAEGMETTFHRAVDMTANYEQSVLDIISTGCTRILTSGGYDKAMDGIHNIKKAVSLSQGKIEIMAGSGVTSTCAAHLAEIGVDALHFSAKKVIPGGMSYRNPHISMGGTTAVDEFALRTVDENEVKAILTIIKQ